MTPAQIKDQALGLAYGVGLAVIVSVATALAQAEPEEILKTAFWVATGSAALLIELYRQRFGGATPPPDLLKAILIQTATDLTQVWKAIQRAAYLHELRGQV